MEVYETEKYLNEYLLFHYGEAADVLVWEPGPRDAVGFAVRCVEDCIDLDALPPAPRALDLGCAVGRSTFELARYCTEVIGIDFSQSFIRAALEVRRHGHIHFDRVEEGVLTSRCVAAVPPEIDRDRVHFEIGDALKLRATLGDFDLLLAANLLCRLEDPIQLVLKFPQLVRPGGQLILVSPYSWSRDFTPQSKWLGGYENDGRIFETFVTLTKFLEPDFTLVRTRELPFLIREHARKYQWGVSHASVWIRKGADTPQPIFSPVTSPALSESPAPAAPVPPEGEPDNSWERQPPVTGPTGHTPAASEPSRPMDWQSRYESGNTPWDEAAPHPALLDFIAGPGPLQGRILLPGCGLGHDVRGISTPSNHVTAIDIAPTAIARAQSFPAAGNEQYAVADLFNLPPEYHAAFDWAIEHTCFCAIDPSMRPAYVPAVAATLKHGAKLLAIFYLNPARDHQPPFGVTTTELDQLFSPHFTLIREWVPPRTFEGREGRELVRLLRRLSI